MYDQIGAKEKRKNVVSTLALETTRGHCTLHVNTVDEE